MANHAALIRQQTQALYPGATVVGRGRNWIQHQAGERMVVDTSISPLHYGVNEDQEIDTAWQPDTGAWQYRMVLADYHVHARNVFNAGNLFEFRDPTTQEWVIFDPQSLNWVNQDNSRQQIAVKQAIDAQAIDDRLYFPAGWGTGRHFEYRALPSRLSKVITIDSLADLPTPTVTGTVWLETEFSLATSSGITIWLDGVQWTKTNNVRVRTANRIEFRNSAGTQVFWHVDFPRAWDSEGNETIGEFEVRRQGGASNLFITVRIPHAWVTAAVFPIYLDPTVDTQVGAGNLDAHEKADNTSFSNTLTLIAADSNTSAASRWNAGMIFTLTGPASGDTINVAYISVRASNATQDNANLDIHCEDVDSAATFAATADVTDRVRTTAAAAWVQDDWAGSDTTTFFNSPSIVAPVQEIIDRPGWASGNNLCVLAIGRSDANKLCRFLAYESAAANAPKLHIEYTAGGVSDLSISKAESTSISETLSLLLLSFIDLQDSIVLSESVEISLASFVLVIDSVSVGETILVVNSLAAISVSEPITVVEAVAIVIPAITTPSDPVLLVQGTNTNDPLTSPSFSPTANALVIVAATTVGLTAPGTFTLTDTFAGGIGTWTKFNAHPTDVTNNQSTGAVWMAQAGASPGSGTVTVNTAASQGTRNVVQVYEVVNGFNSAGIPFYSSKRYESSTGVAPGIVLDSSPEADSLIFAMIGVRGDSDNLITPDVDFVEVGELNEGTSTQGNTQQCQYRNGGADTGVDWSGIASATDIVAIAIEILAAGEGDILFVLETESISLSEVLSLSLFSFIDVQDAVNLSETTGVSLVSFVLVSDSVSVDETVFVDLLVSIFVEDFVGIDETVLVVNPLVPVSVEDTVSIGEDIVLQLSSFVLSLETISVGETVVVSVSDLIVFSFDSISLGEDVFVLVGDSQIVVLENIFIDETTVVSVSDPQVVVLDNVLLSETVFVLLSVYLSIEDTINVGEEVSIQLLSFIFSSESIVVGETVVVSVSDLFILSLDLISLGEDVSVFVEVEGVLVLSVSDSVSLNELLVVTVSDPQIVIFENIFIDEATVVFVGGPQIFVLESIFLNETTVVSVDGPKITVLDNVSTSEVIVVSLSVHLFVEDFIAVGETVLVDLLVTLFVEETILLSETIFIVTDGPSVFVFDTVSVGEDVLVIVEVEGILVLSVSDAISLSEVVFAVVSDPQIVIFENILVQETVFATLFILITVEDTLSTIEDITVVVSDPLIAVFESVAIGEDYLVVIEIEGVLVLSVSDTVSTLDEVTVIVSGLIVAVSDGVVVSELILFATFSFITVSEAISVLDQIGVHLPIDVYVEDIISINESLAVINSGPQIYVNDSIMIVELVIVAVGALEGVRESLFKGMYRGMFKNMR